MDSIDYSQFTGATYPGPHLSESTQELQLKLIKDHVESIGPGFRNILRLNQIGGRYRFIHFIVSDPLKTSLLYKSTKIVGLFYEDLYPVKGVKFKQDFVVILPTLQYKFIADKVWFEPFPELRLYQTNHIWSYDHFRGQIAGMKNYQISRGKFDHHYNELTDLPIEIQLAYNSRSKLSLDILMYEPQNHLCS
jgi:hypothetical protein